MACKHDPTTWLYLGLTSRLRVVFGGEGSLDTSFFFLFFFCCVGPAGGGGQDSNFKKGEKRGEDLPPTTGHQGHWLLPYLPI